MFNLSESQSHGNPLSFHRLSQTPLFLVIDIPLFWGGISPHFGEACPPHHGPFLERPFAFLKGSLYEDLRWFVGKKLTSREQQMNKTAKKMNKYLGANSIRHASNSSLPYKRRPSSYQVSDKELSDGIYRWDPSTCQFIRIKK